MIWFSSDGVVHQQAPGGVCSCGVRHRLTPPPEDGPSTTVAAASGICCGPAHRWSRAIRCVFCGGSWRLGPWPSNPSGYVYVEYFSPLTAQGVLTGWLQGSVIAH